MATLTVREILLGDTRSDDGDIVPLPEPQRGRHSGARRDFRDKTGYDNARRPRYTVKEIIAIATDSVIDAGFEPVDVGNAIALLLVNTLPAHVCMRCLSIPSVTWLLPGPHGDPLCTKCFSMEMHPVVGPDCPPIGSGHNAFDHPLPKSIQDAVFGRLAEWLIPRVNYFYHPEVGPR